MSKIINGDSLDVLKGFEQDTIDAIVCDPPFGYSFMGKDWDKAVPSVEIWQECLRVLKPGAFACVMSAPRSDVQNAMISRLMEAGFRLDFTPIYWTYATGFPKAGNIGKLVDKRLGVEREKTGETKIHAQKGTAIAEMRTVVGAGAFGEARTEELTKATSPQAKALDGSYAGFQPKPAVEVVIIAMKPLSEKTYVDQALKNGKGITWLDDCRVPTDENLQAVVAGVSKAWRESEGRTDINTEKRLMGSAPGAGRFPANLLVSDDVLNDGMERKNGGRSTSPNGVNLVEDTGIYGKYAAQPEKVHHIPSGDSGSYSRYFDLDAWARERLPAEQAMTFPFAIFPKASKSEKNKGLHDLPDRASEVEHGNIGRTTSVEKRRKAQDGKNAATMKNHHPTVKPLKLMSYLITLFSREGDTVLDPFVGSGTTVVAAEQLGRNGVGIEREAEYAEIAKARVKHAKTEDNKEKATK